MAALDDLRAETLSYLRNGTSVVMLGHPCSGRSRRRSPDGLGGDLDRDATWMALAAGSGALLAGSAVAAVASARRKAHATPEAEGPKPI